MLDESYVADAARAIAGRWRRGHVCELAYTPGNMTMYELVLVPFGIGTPYAVASDMDHEKRRSIFQDKPALEVEEVVLVSWLGHGAWPVDLRDVPAWPYFAEKFECNEGDAVAILALLHRVSTLLGFAAMRAVS